MPALILEQSSIDKLKVLTVGVEVRDELGNLIGFFHPAIISDDVDQYECPVSDEELLLRESVGGGRPLSDILKDLRERTLSTRSFGRRTPNKNWRVSGARQPTAKASPDDHPVDWSPTSLPRWNQRFAG